MSLSYLGVDQPERWGRLAKALRAAGAFGLDTEYYALDGSDATEMTTWGRTRVHVWSICVEIDGEYHTAVLPPEALLNPNLRAVLEDPEVTKYLHNAPVDTHAIGNHGVTVWGQVDTLLRGRARLPERHFAGGYGLKDLARDKLQVDDPVTFKMVTTHPKRKVKMKRVVTRSCSCGVPRCKKKTPKKPRRATPKNPNPDNTPHEKSVVEAWVAEVSVLKSRIDIPLQDITWERAQALPHCCGGEAWPGFTERTGLICWPCFWAALVEYAGNDACWALRFALEVLAKEGHAYGHDKPTPQDLPARPRR